MIPAPPGKPAPQTASSMVSSESAAQTFLKTLKTPCRLLVAYSGGGDSTGLLVALAEAIRQAPGLAITLIAATVDHRLRPESAEEARAAGDLCKQLGIAHHVLVWEGDKPSAGIQAAAREARYRLLGALAQDLKADLIVTAHNLDDQNETIAMRKARNPQASGGISEAVLIERRVWVCRPFLAVRRIDIRDYLSRHGVGWVEDPSNENEKFERVRLRRSLADSAPEIMQELAPADRRALAGEVAGHLLAHAAIHDFRFATIELRNWSADNIAHRQAVLYLAAAMGGRTHLAGRDTAERIARFLEARAEHRLTAERVVFDRRRERLYITREKRSLPETIIAPGTVAEWDNRFRIRNLGADPVTVGTRGARSGGLPLMAGRLSEDLPRSVAQRVLATEPILYGGRSEAVEVEPILAVFDRFLPHDLLEIGNALAFLAGLDHFPMLPTR